MSPDALDTGLRPDELDTFVAARTAIEAAALAVARPALEAKDADLVRRFGATAVMQRHDVRVVTIDAESVRVSWLRGMPWEVAVVPLASLELPAGWLATFVALRARIAELATGRLADWLPLRAEEARWRDDDLPTDGWRIADVTASGVLFVSGFDPRLDYLVMPLADAAGVDAAADWAVRWTALAASRAAAAAADRAEAAAYRREEARWAADEILAYAARHAAPPGFRRRLAALLDGWTVAAGEIEP